MTRFSEFLTETVAELRKAILWQMNVKSRELRICGSGATVNVKMGTHLKPTDTEKTYVGDLTFLSLAFNLIRKRSELVWRQWFCTFRAALNTSTTQYYLILANTTRSAHCGTQSP